jgi:aryl-alcohol dehydrogenase-like predicted oxidoreductase
VLSHPAVTGAIVGVRSEREALELAPAAEMRLPEEKDAAIDRVTSAQLPQ